MAKFPSWINVKSIEVDENKASVVYKIRWLHPSAWRVLWGEFSKKARESGYSPYHPKIIWMYIKLLVMLNLARDK